MPWDPDVNRRTPHLRLLAGAAASGSESKRSRNASVTSRHRPQQALGSFLMALVSLTPEAARQFDGLPRSIKTRVLAVFERLQHWPTVSGAKPLRGNLSGSYRIRTGDYRVRFHAQAERVIIERIGHRAGFYED